jgi:hypothetical protein
MPDVDLLRLLLGDAAVPLAHQPLTELFNLRVERSRYAERSPAQTPGVRQ